MPKQSNKTEYATKSDLQKLHRATKADIKELRGNINQDIKTHMGVLYKKFSDDVKVLAEAHLDTGREVKNLGARVGGFEVKMDILINTVGEVKVDVAEIKNELKNKADLKDHKLLEKRAATLEATT
ncbi:MAG: hypothetical protein AAB488_02780 [Patescibacteria group bacterium]